MTRHEHLQIWVREEGEADRVVEIVDGMVFGREESVDVTVGKNGWTSKMHARTIYRDGRWLIEDLGSRNKTRLVDGPTLTAGERHELAEGQEYLLGKVSLSVIASVKNEKVSEPVDRPVGSDTDFVDVDIHDEIGQPEATVDEFPVPPSTPPAEDRPAAQPTISSSGGTAFDDEIPMLQARPKDKVVDPAPPSLDAPTSPGPIFQAPPPTAEPPQEASPPAAPAAAPVPPQPSRSSESDVGGQTMFVSTGPQGSDQILKDGLLKARPRLILTDDAIRKVVPIEAAEFIIGREAQESIEVHCTIAHDAVSGLHAKIYFDGDSFFIEDLGSRNGVFVDQVRLASHQPQRLRPESMIRIGVIDALFVIDQDSGGRVIEKEIYLQATKILKKRGAITPQQLTRALSQVQGDPRRLSEVLLIDRIVDLQQWIQAFQDAEKVGLVIAPGENNYKKLIIILIGLIGVASIVVIYLLIKVLSDKT